MAKRDSSEQDVSMPANGKRRKEHRNDDSGEDDEGNGDNEGDCEGGENEGEGESEDEGEDEGEGEGKGEGEGDDEGDDGEDENVDYPNDDDYFPFDQVLLERMLFGFFDSTKIRLVEKKDSADAPLPLDHD